MSLGEQLHGARIVRHDPESGLTLAWMGGHGVLAFREDGLEVAFWSVGDFAESDAAESDVLESMEERMAAGDYADFS